jgi:cupin superfamily acireductone dioxygenase involved in methionine salvage
MPLTEKITFTTTLERSDKVQIPKLIRWRFKIENDQALKVAVNFLETHKGWQFFYTKMRKDGRISIPKLVLSLFEEDEKTNLAGCALEVMIEPA